jgi:5-formyltetrahydrofolate cyclo-ligase
MTTQVAKSELRKSVIERRSSISLPARQTANRTISKRVLAMGGFNDAQTVMAYMSIAAEFSTMEFVRATLALGKNLVLPKVNRDEKKLDLFRVKNIDTDLTPGVWEILEPNPERCEKISAEDIEFVLVPGVAFDVHCNRLGYGGGFYDRLLDDLGPFVSLVAPAFALQIVERVPIEEHDIPLNVIITEDQKYVRHDFLNQES